MTLQDQSKNMPKNCKQSKTQVPHDITYLTVAIAMFDALNICVARCTGGFLARLTLNSAEGVKPVEHEVVDSIV